ncbi:MAG: HEPN domain-containing protein [Deferrisomatales bacterium]
MSAPGTELAALWLHKAQNDLVTGEQTLLLPDGPTDTVCFHAQQAAEKALKALLTAHESTAPRGHDLLRLLDLATEHLPELAGFRAPLAQMTAYAIEVRYPGGLDRAVTGRGRRGPGRRPRGGPCGAGGARAPWASRNNAGSTRTTLRAVKHTGTGAGPTLDSTGIATSDFTSSRRPEPADPAPSEGSSRDRLPDP